MKLVVTQPFADFKVGDTITKADDVKAFLESHPGSVVKAPDDPPPAEDAAGQPAAQDSAADKKSIRS